MLIDFNVRKFTAIIGNKVKNLKISSTIVIFCVVLNFQLSRHSVFFTEANSP